MDKLGTTTQNATAVMADLAALDTGGGVANGPEDLINWDAIDWRHQTDQVQRLRQRIFKAAQAGNHKQVRNLQKLILRSRANTLVSMRQASQRNTGRHTAGVDGQVALTSPERSDLAMLLHHRVGSNHALPVRRVYIPKKAGNAHSGFPLSPTAPSNNGCVTHWNPNGRPGWTPSNTGSGRAVDAMTRSR